MTGPIAAALLAAVLAAPSTPSDEEIRERVESLLGSIDTPVRPSQWRALGARAVAVLQERSTSLQEFPSRRARAVDGLAAIGGPEATRTVLVLAQERGHPFAVRAAALRGAGHLLPPDRLLEALRPALEEPGPVRVRAVAAEALARNGGVAGCAAARARMEKEKPDERGAFHRVPASCDKPR